MRRSPDTAPREEAVRRQVRVFKDAIATVADKRSKAPRQAPKLDENAVAKMFEEIAALEAQLLEDTIVQILLAGELAGELAGRIEFKKKNNIESELLLSKRTLGQLKKELERAGIDANTNDLLENALEARNFLMHHFFIWHSKDLISPDEGRGRMIEELQKLRFRIARMRIIFGKFRESFYENVLGISEETVKKLYEEYLQEHGRPEER